MPLRATKTTNPSIFSRTLHAQNATIIRVEHHHTPPPQVPQSDPLVPVGPQPMECDDEEATPADREMGINNLDGNLGIGNVGVNNVLMADEAYAKLVGTLLDEPLPSDMVYTVTVRLQYIQ